MSQLFKKKSYFREFDVSDADLDYVLSHFVLKEFKKINFNPRKSN
jgi:hypothetical protein